MRNKIFTKIIITTLLVVFLTFNVGKVTRVSAVGTTAAIAGTAFILTGAVYLSYVALTQGELVLPAAQDLHNYLGSIGRKVSQYPSGAAAYQDIYQGLLRDPAANVIDGVWTWTQDRIKDFVNDFSDTRIISDIVAHDVTVDTTFAPTNGFTYPAITDTVCAPNGAITDLAGLQAQGYNISFFTGPLVAYENSGNMFFVSSNISTPARNLKMTNGRYIGQYWNGSDWIGVRNYSLGFYAEGNGYRFRYGIGTWNSQSMYLVTNTDIVSTATPEYSYPLFPQEVIHDEATDEDLPLVIPDPIQTQLPSWVDPDNNNRPIIPYVPIPNIPTGIPTPPGYTGSPQWGFPLQDLLDLLEELAEALMSIDAIARIINEFAGQHGDNYYLEYNDGDTNYYTYYQPTVFDNDTEYVTYNINVSEQEDIIPVDLNTISLYTQNRYLEQIKNSAVAGSSMLRDLAVFWHDVDPEITYIVLGCCILVLIGAFTGKLGHS